MKVVIIDRDNLVIIMKPGLLALTAAAAVPLRPLSGRCFAIDYMLKDASFHDSA